MDETCVTAHALLDEALDAVLQALQPDRESDEARRRVVADMRDLVHAALPAGLHCGVETFGSFRAGLHMPGSDLDFAVTGWVLAEPEEEDAPAGGGARRAAARQRVELCEFRPEDQKALLATLADAVEDGALPGGAREVQRVLHARVPVVKFVHAATGCSCDFSISRPECAFKAEMQRLLGTIDRRYACLYRLVKAWAAAHGLNDASSGTFNSWTLGLLVAFLMQLERPALLPPIWQLLEEREPHERAPRVLQARGVSSEALRHAANRAAMRAAAYKERQRRAREGGGGGGGGRAVADLLLEFFRLHGGQMRAWASGRGADVCASTWWGRAAPARWGAHRQYVFCVEDPFDAGDNTARSVGTHNHLGARTTARYIAGVFEASAQCLQDALEVAGSAAPGEVLRALAWLFGPGAVLPGVAPPVRLPAALGAALGGRVKPGALAELAARFAAQGGGTAGALGGSSALVNSENWRREDRGGGGGGGGGEERAAAAAEALEVFRELLRQLGPELPGNVCLGDHVQQQQQRRAQRQREKERQRQERAQQERRRDAAEALGAEALGERMQQLELGGGGHGGGGGGGAAAADAARPNNTPDADEAWLGLLEFCVARALLPPANARASRGRAGTRPAAPRQPVPQQPPPGGPRGAVTAAAHVPGGGGRAAGAQRPPPELGHAAAQEQGDTAGGRRSSGSCSSSSGSNRTLHTRGEGL